MPECVFQPLFVGQPPVFWLESCQSYSLTPGLCLWVQACQVGGRFGLCKTIFPALFRCSGPRVPRPQTLPWRRGECCRCGHTPLSFRSCFCKLPQTHPSTLPPFMLLFNGQGECFMANKECESLFTGGSNGILCGVLWGYWNSWQSYLFVCPKIWDFGLMGWLQHWWSNIICAKEII